MRLGLLGVAIVAAAMAGVSSASAFQFVNPDTNSNGTLNLTDPDQQPQVPANRFSTGGAGSGASAGALKFGNTTLQFGMSNGRDNSQYGPSPALQEKFLQSPASRTVPSQGW